MCAPLGPVTRLPAARVPPSSCPPLQSCSLSGGPPWQPPPPFPTPCLNAFVCHVILLDALAPPPSFPPQLQLVRWASASPSPPPSLTPALPHFCLVHICVMSCCRLKASPASCPALPTKAAACLVGSPCLPPLPPTCPYVHGVSSSFMPSQQVIARPWVCTHL